MKFKIVMTYSKRERKIRLFRISYAKMHKQITFGLQPHWWKTEKKFGCNSLYSYKLWVLGVVFHWHDAWSMTFAD